jgi:uncharacterized repeat protein (TIGR01451 family)
MVLSAYGSVGSAAPPAFAAATNEAYLVNVYAGNSTLVVGSLNQVQLFVKDTGSGSLDNVVVTVLPQAPLTIFGGNGVFNVVSISGFSYVILSLQVYVPSSALAAGLGSLAVTVNFAAPDGSSQVAQNNISFFLHSDPRLFQVQVGQLNNTVIAGQVSTVSFLVLNSGEQTIFLPSFTLTLPLPLVVIGAAQTLAGYTTLSPGQSLTFYARVSANPTAAPGVYPGTLAVTYVDNAGIQHAQDYGIAINMTSLGQTFTLRVTQLNNTLVSGESSIASFAIQNLGQAAAYEPSFALSLASPLVFMSTTGGASPGSIAPGQTMVYSAAISSTPGLTSGVFPGELKVTFADRYGIQHVETFDVGFVLTSQTQLRFVPLQSSLQPGVSNDVRLVLRNEGSTPVAQVHLTSNYPSTSSVIGQMSDVASLGPGASSLVDLHLFVPLSSAGMPLVVAMGAAYVGSSGRSQTLSQGIGFFVNNTSFTSPISLSFGPTTLQTGAKNNVTLSVTNAGRYPVQGLQITLKFSGQYEWVGQNLLQVPSLAPGATQIVSGVVYVPTTAPSSDALEASLGYYFTGQQRSETREIGFLSRGSINLQLTSVTLLPQPAVPGQVVSMTLTLTNLGTTAAGAVTATTNLSSGFRVFGASSYFVGDMQIDTPTTFTLSVFVSNETRPGNYQFMVHLSYLDNLRDQVSSSLTIPVQVGGAAGPLTGGSGTTTARRTSGGLGIVDLLLPIAVVAIVVGLAYLFLVRRRRGPRI